MFPLLWCHLMLLQIGTQSKALTAYTAFVWLLVNVSLFITHIRWSDADLGVGKATGVVVIMVGHWLVLNTGIGTHCPVTVRIFFFNVFKVFLVASITKK